MVRKNLESPETIGMQRLVQDAVEVARCLGFGQQANQTVYPALRFSGFIFFEKHVHSSLYSVTVCEARVTPS